MMYDLRMDHTSLESLIRTYIDIPTYPTGSGWYPVLCKVCNDHGKKGPRGAFRFDNDSVAYHCFNCGPEKNTGYDPTRDPVVPKKMVTVFNDFGIPEDQWKQIQLENYQKYEHNGKSSAKPDTQVLAIEPKSITILDHFYKLQDADDKDKWKIIAIYYLEQRGIDINSQDFYLSTGISKVDKKAKEWVARVIIPIYKNDNIIFYIGRTLVERSSRKYLSPSVPKEKVLYGYDKLFIDRDKPLYIVEGWFDAYSIDGVGILGNELSKYHIEWLNKSPRTKVYIPDRFGNGKDVALKALSVGWSISTPDIGSCKDMNEAVNKYGSLYVMKSIADNTASDFEGELKLGLYCD